MRISDWSSDVCSSDLRVISGEAKVGPIAPGPQAAPARPADQSEVLGYSVTDGRAVSVPPVDGANARQDWPSGWVQHRSIRLDQLVAQANRYRSEEHTSELQSLMRISYAVFCLKQKNTDTHNTKQ